ncbi:MAG: TauD/TfdA family dioxygenase [Acidimicrobiia bacterium]|nr:TauD/TfdA family dioxygenase [Acidimicrobiia bacterium]
MATSLEIRPVNPVIGAEVSGVDLTAELDGATIEAIRAALGRHGVLFFRDQPIGLDHDRHIGFGRRFGDLHIHPAAELPERYPELLRIHADETSKGVAGNAWHSDVSCDAEPPMGSILALHTVPPSGGGDTMFSSMYAAYDALSEPMKRFLEPLSAIHSGRHVYDRGGYRSDREYPESEHPLIRTHPETGRQALFVNSGFTTRIRGLARRESDALLAMLFEHIAQPKFQCRFRWEAHSVAFWDNRCVQHYAVWDYFPEVRSGWRVTIKGDKPYYDAEPPQS